MILGDAQAEWISPNLTYIAHDDVPYVIKKRKANKLRNIPNIKNPYAGEIMRNIQI